MSPLIPRRRQRGRLYDPARALTAAAVAAGSAGENGNASTLNQTWQTRAFGWYDKLGECWNPAQFYARAMSKLTIHATELDDDGVPQPTENDDAAALVDAIQDPSGTPKGILSSYGRLLFLVGEGRLCQSRPPEKFGGTSDLPPVWEFLSSSEITIARDGRNIVRSVPGGEKIEYDNLNAVEDSGDPEPGQMRMWRLWRKHPENSQKADSPVRGVLDLYEQLWWVTMGERADLQSRIANAGILLVPEEIDFDAPDAENEAAGEDPEIDSFTRRLGEGMMTAIGDPGSASAAVPQVVRGPADMLHPDIFRHLKMHDPSASLFVGQREESLIKRISIGLDLPVEEVMGLSMANHWTAWKIDEEKWAHVEPVAQMFVDDLAAAYLRPMLRAAGAEGWQRFGIGYDNTALVTDPDKGKTAITLHKDGAVGNAAAREANGFTDDDAMSAEERQEWLAIQLRDSSLIGGEGSAEGGEGSEEEDGGSEEEQPPAEEDSQVASAAGVNQLLAFASERARAAAGAHLRSRKRSCPDCLEGTDALPNADLVAAVGRAVVGKLGAREDALARQMTVVFIETCQGMGLDMPTHVELIAEAHFARTMFDPKPITQELLLQLVS